MTQRVVIPDWLPPPVANGSRQRHWATVRREVEIVKKMVWASCKLADWQYVGDDAPRQRLTVSFTFPVKRKRDEDNLYARCKHVQDAIKPWIVDDDLAHLELVVKASVQAGVKQTELVLEAA